MSITTRILVTKSMAITRVYSGKAGACCCGCSGTYWDNDGSVRGTRAVKRILHKLSLFPPRVDAGPNYNSIEIGGRVYTAYVD